MDFSFNRKSVVLLRYDGVFATSGLRIESTNREIFSVGVPHDETIGLLGILSLWICVECKTGRSVVFVAGGN